MKEFILEKNIKDVDKDEYYLRYNGGGQFEIRRRVDISPVYNDEGQPMIYYAKDMYILNQERVTSEKEKIVIQCAACESSGEIEDEDFNYDYSGLDLNKLQ